MTTTRASRPRSRAPGARQPTSLAATMGALENSATAQARKTYLRHGAPEPVLGVSFATMKSIAHAIGVDHALAEALWETGVFEARILATKVADPRRVARARLDRWARDLPFHGCAMYLASLAADGPHAEALAQAWLASREAGVRCTGWALAAQRALRDADAPDAWFAPLLDRIERSIHEAPNRERYAMNDAVIAIGGRSAALRRAALASARRIGAVEVDHGDTECKTPDAASKIEKAWAHATAKGFATPAEQERARKSPRLRC